MKLLIKILLFVFVALITNIKVVSATITFPNIQEATTSYSFHRELSEIDFKVIENDLANCCQRERKLVVYRNWGTGVEAAAVKGGTNLAKTPVGRSGNVINSVAKNSPTTINGTKFTGHALDQMQARGIISPSSVLDIVKNPAQVVPGKTLGTTVFIRDNLKVVTNTAGDIITVMWQ